MAINDDLAYEVIENGERVVVKSIESVSRVYLRFSNRTSRPVDVSWRDFDGKRQIFTGLEPGQSYDINSYLTHPWEFTDRATKENYVIQNNPIFRAPTVLGNLRQRTNWNITIGVRTLRYSAMLRVALATSNVKNLYELELPRPLEEELRSLITKLRSTPPIDD